MTLLVKIAKSEKGGQSTSSHKTSDFIFTKHSFTRDFTTNDEACGARHPPGQLVRHRFRSILQGAPPRQTLGHVVAPLSHCRFGKSAFACCDVAALFATFQKVWSVFWGIFTSSADVTPAPFPPTLLCANPYPLLPAARREAARQRASRDLRRELSPASACPSVCFSPFRGYPRISPVYLKPGP